ncbi:MAG: serine/threonine-protein kinase [Planctomycetes bacterium]|nr:serine/threonine-protein kinase [Planctomycetota bacterium]
MTSQGPRAELVVTEGLDAGRRLVLRPGERASLGRDAEATLRIVDDRASRQHAVVELQADGLWVTDVGSRNGTLLDDRPLVAHARARVGERGLLRIGAHAIQLTSTGAGPPAPPGGWPPGLREEYDVTRLLGGGAAGMVYAGAHRASGAAVALKVLAPTIADADLPARFAREAQVRVRHPHVVAVHDLRVDGGRAWLIMELVDGRSLDQPLREGTPLPVPVVLRIGADAAEGLAAAHACGVVHRDVKPANIIVERGGRAKLGDFGLAKVLGSALTATGLGLGTLDYVAPEQALDAKRADARSDLYSLGATLFHALAGRPAIDSRADGFFDRLTAETPPSLARVRPDCPRPVAAAVAALLEKHPDDRPASAAEVASALRRLGGA